jgi:hypothetical protein
MKQTAVEWLYERLERMIPRTALYNIDKEEYFNKAKEIEKQQQNEFAIGFAEWCIKKRIDFFDSTEIGETYTINGFVSKYKMNELLEIYKKEKGL